MITHKKNTCMKSKEDKQEYYYSSSESIKSFDSLTTKIFTRFYNIYSNILGDKTFWFKKFLEKFENEENDFSSDLIKFENFVLVYIKNKNESLFLENEKDQNYLHEMRIDMINEMKEEKFKKNNLMLTETIFNKEYRKNKFFKKKKNIKKGHEHIPKKNQKQTKSPAKFNIMTIPFICAIPKIECDILIPEFYDNLESILNFKTCLKNNNFFYVMNNSFYRISFKFEPFKHRKVKINQNKFKKNYSIDNFFLFNESIIYFDSLRNSIIKYHLTDCEKKQNYEDVILKLETKINQINNHNVIFEKFSNNKFLFSNTDHKIYLYDFLSMKKMKIIDLSMKIPFSDQIIKIIKLNNSSFLVITIRLIFWVKNFPIKKWAAKTIFKLKVCLKKFIFSPLISTKLFYKYIFIHSIERNEIGIYKLYSNTAKTILKYRPPIIHYKIIYFEIFPLLNLLLVLYSDHLCEEESDSYSQNNGSITKYSIELIDIITLIERYSQ